MLWFVLNNHELGDPPIIFTSNGVTSEIWVRFPAFSLAILQENNCTHYKVRDEITYPFPNFNGYTVAPLKFGNW